MQAVCITSHFVMSLEFLKLQVWPLLATEYPRPSGQGQPFTHLPPPFPGDLCIAVNHGVFCQSPFDDGNSAGSSAPRLVEQFLARTVPMLPNDSFKMERYRPCEQC